MRVARTMLVLLAGLLSSASVAVAQVPLTLTEALARARERAPQVISARLAIDESRARLAGANHLQSNPDFDAGVGNRQGAGTRSTDIDIGIGQSFEPGSRRSSRRDIATAGIDQSIASADEATPPRCFFAVSSSPNAFDFSIVRWNWRTTSFRSPTGVFKPATLPSSTSTSRDPPQLESKLSARV